MNKKFHLQCIECGTTVAGFKDWFGNDQSCPGCGGHRVDVVYHRGPKDLHDLIRKTPGGLPGHWFYKDFLPVVEERNIISHHEGKAPIERWEFLEGFAKRAHSIDCKIYAHRLDTNPATGTFKDLSGTVVSSVLKENGRKQFVIASTGNTAVAYSRYCAVGGITVYGFIPDNASVTQIAEVGLFGQRVYRVRGDYARTKEVAAEFARSHGFLQAGGNLDPMRNEAKKTMVYEWLRLMDDFPTVYMQALSGGTGPLAISKVYREFQDTDLLPRMPRQLLVQSDACAPMAMAWKKAKKEGFPEGWEKEYPVIRDPQTIIPTLATGHPKTYPYIGPIVKDSGGEIFSYEEKKTIDVARLVAFETAVQMGPAAALPVGGLFRALNEGYIRNGDVVVILIGEGIRRSPEFMESTLYASEEVTSAEECTVSERTEYRDRLWKPFLDDR